jgi:phosphate transport system permease protein
MTTAMTVPEPTVEAGSEVETFQDVPRSLSTRTIDDWASLVGSAVAALAIVWVFYEHVLGWSGTLGFIVSTWFVFMVFYAAVTAMTNPTPSVIDRLSAAVTTSGAAVVGFALGSTIVYVVLKGWPALHHLNFYTQTMAGTRPTDPLTKGGILHAIVGSAIQIGIATAISLPLGLTTAIFLSEVGGRFAQVVRTVVEAMTALPDILAGLFIYVTLIVGLGMDKSGMAVSLALAVTMIPIVARSSEVVLRIVPSGLREASFALGVSRLRTVWGVVLPTARAGLASSLILGVARIAGETAPLLIVSGASAFFNKDPLSNPMNSLPLFIFTGVRSGEPQFIARAYGAATLLLVFVFLLFVLTRFLARDKVGRR